MKLKYWFILLTVIFALTIRHCNQAIEDAGGLKNIILHKAKEGKDFIREIDRL